MMLYNRLNIGRLLCLTSFKTVCKIITLPNTSSSRMSICSIQKRLKVAQHHVASTNLIENYVCVQNQVVVARNQTALVFVRRGQVGTARSALFARLKAAEDVIAKIVLSNILK